MIYKYDLFISYASENQAIANFIVDKIEKRGYKCFIAPRDIKTGSEYAVEIVNGISNSIAVLLVFSIDSNKSHYVLREINSAVSRNKPIIPLRIEDFLPSEAMEFYLGPTHWLDAFPEVIDTHLDQVEMILISLKSKGQKKKEKQNTNDETVLLKIEDINQIGLDYKKMVMKEIEIDYLCVSKDKYKIDDSIEGTIDDWVDSAKEYENDTSILLVKNNEIIGYCDAYPVTDQAYEELINGDKIIRDYMIDVFCLGGEFNLYIPMLAVEPKYENQGNYAMLFRWLFKHIEDWKKQDIYSKKIGITVYSPIMEKFVLHFGFQYKCQNPANGKIYETSYDELTNNNMYKKLISQQ